MKGLKDVGQYKRVTASGAIVPVGGTLLRFICTTAGTLQITEGVVPAGNDIVSVMTLAANAVVIFHMDCPLGAYAVVGGGLVGTFVAG